MFFYTLDQSFLFFQLLKIFHKAYCYKVFKAWSWFESALKKQLDPDPHWEKELDPNPDPQKMNADPQSCNFVNKGNEMQIRKNRASFDQLGSNDLKILSWNTLGVKEGRSQWILFTVEATNQYFYSGFVTLKGDTGTYQVGSIDQSASCLS